MIRILLVDDHAVVRAGYRQLLECAPEYQVVAEAASAAAGYRRFLECAPDVVITDLSLPGVGGIEVLRRLGGSLPATKVLIFSGKQEPHIVRALMQAGIHGFVNKNGPLSELRKALEAVALDPVPVLAHSSLVFCSRYRLRSCEPHSLHAGPDRSGRGAGVTGLEPATARPPARGTQACREQAGVIVWSAELAHVLAIKTL